MALLILCDPNYRNNAWCDTKLKGIYDEAFRRRISVKLYTNIDTFKNDAAKLGKDSSVILLFNSMKYLSSVAEVLEDLAIHPILSVTESDITFPRIFSQVCGDTDSPTKELVDYLNSKGKRKIALIGASRYSAAALNKVEMLRRCVPPENYEVFYQKEKLTDSIEAFFKKRDEFDAAICIDDNQGIFLIEYLLAHGAYNPDFYIISYGDTIISRLYKIGLSTVSTGFYACGKAMVESHVHREKYGWSSTMIRVNCEFKVRESANGLASGEHTASTLDVSTPRIARLERMLFSCDLTDFKILYGLICNYSYERICDTCFLSPGAIKYRVRRLRLALGYQTRDEMISLLKDFISKEKLLQHIAETENAN